MCKISTGETEHRAVSEQGHAWANCGRHVPDAGDDAYAGLRSLPDGAAATRTVDAIAGQVTPFLKDLDDRKPHGDPEGETGLSAATVGRKLSEPRNYWRYLPEVRPQFAGRRVGDLVKRRKTKEDLRQQFRSEDVVRLWREAEQRGDPEVAKTIEIAACSDARIEGVAQLRTTDIRTDPDTKIRFMCMADKSAEGDRFVRVHPQLARLIDDAVKYADRSGYLIHSDARSRGCGRPTTRRTRQANWSRATATRCALQHLPFAARRTTQFECEFPRGCPVRV